MSTAQNIYDIGLNFSFFDGFGGFLKWSVQHYLQVPDSRGEQSRSAAN